MNERKKRVLWMGEATFLNTGYGVYGHEVLNRLHSTGKYEIAEAGVYADALDVRSHALPWKFYGNVPHMQEEGSIYESQQANQWGLWRFEDMCLDFKPDVVIDVRDWWMFEFESRSPFRGLFHWAIMPTIDSAPQMENWLATYLDADAVCAYSEFGRDVMMKESNDRINFVDLASPAANYDIFKPVPDKRAHKEACGFDPNAKIVGTIMRNQKRKLYPQLIESFKLFMEKYPQVAENTYLYLHTHYPDIGWDIPRLIKESGIGHRILCTYVCESCNGFFPSFFHDAVQTCTHCGNPTAKMPSGDKGTSFHELASILNVFDLYVQYSICEGFGMPQVEAAACGVPVMSVDYSAMSSVVRNIKGTPLKVLTMQREAETHAMRAIPDNNDLAAQMASFLSKPESIRARKGRDTYLACRQFYQWKKTAGVWEHIIDNAPYGTWDDAPPRIIEPNLNIPNGLSREDFVRWCVAHIWGEPSQVDSYVALRMMRDLNYGQAIEGYGGPYYSEDSLLISKPRYVTFTKESVVNTLGELGETRNYWEQRRCGMIQEDTPSFIKLANMRK